MLEYILDGGFMMFPLLFLSILSFAVIFDRLRVFRLAQTDAALLQNEVAQTLDQGDVDGALDVCRKHRGPVGAVLLVGLERYRKLRSLGRGAAEMESNVGKSMADYGPHVVDALEKRMNLLTLVGSISPLLGMTGTVTGMIASFNAMAEAGGLDAALVSAGISEALITTAAGLIIAIPAVVAYNIFSKKVDRHILEIEEATAELVDYIALSGADA
ncbi:MotA/TolQ/ExbB proton channel family protein [bacterium]|nr:MotA/TolQ/ExbB proton channel family protein [bacterium]